jgi:Kef-type K+ transport system membrane component KefB
MSLLLQISVVLATTLACGWIAQRLGQTRAIGEVFGGILIGPSVFGRFAPEVSGRLFPPGSLGALDLLSTTGLVLFLFLIGSELDRGHLRRESSTAVFASIMSILLPFSIAVLAAPLLIQ